MKITIRERKLKGGNRSLALDIYHEGTRRVEMLGLYLVPEVDEEAKKVNENAMKRALAIKADYTLHPEKLTTKKVKDKAIAPAYPKIKKLVDWLDQYEVLQFSGGVSQSIMVQVRRTNELIRRYLKHIKRENILLKSIDRFFITGYLAWLREHVNENYKSEVKGYSDATLHQYQMRLNCVLNRAVREGMLKANPFYTLSQQERYAVPSTNREYLTKDELQRFLAVETDGKATQQAFGFASFTGLRLSDIQNLIWKDVRLIGYNKFVYLTQQKTGEQVAIPLGKMAQQYLPERPEDAKGTDKVFKLPTHTAIQSSCRWIAKKANINKTVSFHTSRHTFATLTLEACKDIKMVSKLLGHKSVLTTQVYAEVQMASKMEAVSNLNGNFGRRKSAI